MKSKLLLSLEYKVPTTPSLGPKAAPLSKLAVFFIFKIQRNTLDYNNNNNNVTATSDINYSFFNNKSI